jgi:hypothetical protein
MRLVEIANILVPLVPAPAPADDRALRKLIAELAAEIAAPATENSSPNSAAVKSGEIVPVEEEVAGEITTNGHAAAMPQAPRPAAAPAAIKGPPRRRLLYRALSGLARAFRIGPVTNHAAPTRPPHPPEHRIRRRT